MNTLSQCIAGLLSEDAQERRDAINAVTNRLFHQGTVGTETVRALPILIDIALAPTTRDRHLTLNLMRWLLTCLPENREDALGNASGAAPSELALATAAAIRAGRSRYLSVLADPDSRARGAAASLSAFSASTRVEAAEVAQAIAKTLPVETDPLALGNELCAFALAARRAGCDGAETIAAHVQSRETIVRVAAAVAVLGSTDARLLLDEAARSSADAAPVPLYEPAEFLWASGDPGLLAAEALAFAARRQRSQKDGPAWSQFEKHAIVALKTIIASRLPYRDVEAKRVTAADVMMAQYGEGPVPIEFEPPAEDLQKGYSLLALAGHLLEIGFGELVGRAEPASRAELRPEQLELVRFSIEAKLAAYYSRFALPGSVAELAAFLRS